MNLWRLETALPPDVRKVFDLPKIGATTLGYALAHSHGGAAPNHLTVSGRAEPFRTSGGRATAAHQVAEPRPHIRWQSHARTSRQTL